MAAEDPSVSGVSGRYATALFELAREEKSVDAVKADLDRFEAMLNDSADLKRLVRSPVFSAEVQAKALNAVLDKAGITGTPAKFLARKRRFIANQPGRIQKTVDIVPNEIGNGIRVISGGRFK